MSARNLKISPTCPEGHAHTNKAHRAKRAAKRRPRKSRKAARAYRAEYAHIAREICILGGDIESLARAFQVKADTIEQWQKTHKKFFDAYKAGTDFAYKRVKQSLYTRACGYDFHAFKFFRFKHEIIATTYLKHVPADVKAAMFWLVNRCPEKWRYNP